MERQAAVAGQFYSGTARQLRSDLDTLIPRVEQKRRVFGVISPHAGYVYSGGVAGKLFASLQLPPTVLILGPNHRGEGAPAALYPDGSWQTPLGAVPVSSPLNSLLLKHVPYLQADSAAHRQEHSLEVQVPFLQYLRPDISISAICLGQGGFDPVRQIGEGIARAIAAFGQEVLIVASSDMTHYESAKSAQHKDTLALERVLAFDPKGLLDVCRSERITMCGVVPAAIMLVAAQAMGATHAEVVAYATSGDVTGDDSQVVGYAAVEVL